MSLFEPITSFFIQYEWLMYSAFGVCIFFFCYRWTPRLLDKVYGYTVSSQKDILEIVEKMRIKTTQKKTVVSLWVFSLCMGVLPVFATLPNILLGVILGFAFFLMTWFLVAIVMKGLWTQYCDGVADHLGEAVSLMANGMKVGLTVTQSMERVVKRMRGPLASEFTLVLNKIKLGMSLEEALEEMSVRVERPDIVMLVTSINILKETGGNLVETFTVIADTMRSRQKVNSKIKSLTAQSMMQARIMSFIPFGLLGILFFINKPYVVILFTTALGWVCLVLICILVFSGGKIMKNMAKIDI